ncbi:hypothetical protein SCHPADRAFT_417343 [Schizopora paradoxa]|uniref:Uncharacterized protein n=1 Tax=Schizopora paradoxa TaxID=27342 RepID=A0A0H2RKS3_9AGAM|nr:hypothetical protein SCHPADRAFT_417343 [Schizopora paradoxa]
MDLGAHCSFFLILTKRIGALSVKALESVEIRVQHSLLNPFSARIEKPLQDRGFLLRLLYMRIIFRISLGNCLPALSSNDSVLLLRTFISVKYKNLVASFIVVIRPTLRLLVGEQYFWAQSLCFILLLIMEFFPLFETTRSLESCTGNARSASGTHPEQYSTSSRNSSQREQVRHNSSGYGKRPCVCDSKNQKCHRCCAET